MKWYRFKIITTYLGRKIELKSLLARSIKNKNHYLKHMLEDPNDWRYEHFKVIFLHQTKQEETYRIELQDLSEDFTEAFTKFFWDNHEER